MVIFSKIDMVDIAIRLDDSYVSFAGAGCNQHCLNVRESKAVSCLENLLPIPAKLPGQVHQRTNADSMQCCIRNHRFPGTADFFGGDVKRHRRTLQVHINTDFLLTLQVIKVQVKYICPDSDHIYRS